jgi:anti-anti-sigma factor
MTATHCQHLNVETLQGCLVLTIAEKRLIDETVCSALRNELLAAVQESGAKKVVVDYRNVERVASVAFRPMLSLLRFTNDNRIRMVLCNLSEFVADVFRATHLLVNNRAKSAPFEAHATLPAALVALNVPAAQD